MSIFTGSGVAIITPFNEKGINYDEFKKIIDFQLENNTDAILVCGTTGEPPTMSEDEKKEAISFAINYVNGRVPVIAGVGSNDTAHVISLAKFAEDAGADALLVVTPYYNKASQEGMKRHFLAVADALDHTPIIIYNVPGRTGCNILPKTIAAIADHKNICGVKESSGNLVQNTELIGLVGDKLDIYSGDDNLTFPLMAIGAKGVISVAANIIPREMHEFAAACLEGDMKKGREMHHKYFELFQALFMDVNPIPVKTAANMMGFNAGNFRLPLCRMSEEMEAKLHDVLTRYGLVK